MYKRGQGIQFNWIFVIVVSAIFLLFFSGFLIKYIDLQETKQNAEIARKFANSILSIKGTEQYKNLSVSTKFGVDYDCDEITVNKDSNIDFRVPYNIVMDSFESKNLIMWVEDYKKGFLVDRVVFIIDSNKKYYFDEKYLDNLPPNIPITRNPNNADVIVSSDINIDGKKNIKISGNNLNLEGEDFRFSGEEFFVYVAAFSNKDVFICTKEKLDESFDRLREIYIGKIQRISFTQGSLCNYNPLKSALENGDVNEIISENKALANFGCEVIF